MNAYLIMADSFRIIDEEIVKIVKNNLNIIKYDMSLTKIEELIEEASYISLLDEPKFLIAKNADFFASDKLKEEETEQLIKYLSAPNSNTIIIFTTQKKLDERKKITKLMRNNFQVIVKPKLNEYELNKKINLILKSWGFNIEYDAIKYIQKCCLNNYDLVYNELEKIKIYYNDNKNILKNDLKKLISSNIEDNVFKMINAIIEKNNKLMFKLFEDLKILKEEPIAFISLLAREYRMMYLIKKLNMNSSDFCTTMNIQKWQYDKFSKHSYEYSVEELENKLQELYKLDLKIKKGQIDKYLGFELFMLNI